MADALVEATLRDAERSRRADSRSAPKVRRKKAA
jgi:hypothetical protein